ncbi:amidase family protein [Microbacterium sp. zg.Y909]|uniref:amidase family protein n=1 Tax=Microbacterium sp. zg.Y909 TaxID=2969413 RepID=UPI00214C1E68|nr:amidase family protein [Microbacterium sp. zg.Y909]MCR2823956.1 amidase family protein [Microbacterium sp. zg.Y909]
MNTKRTRGVLATAAVLGTVGAMGVSLPASAVAPSTAPLLAPYFTELDLTDDSQVTTADLDVAASALGLTSGAEGWAEVAVIDTNADGTITVADLADLAQRMIYDDGPFELVEASVLDMQAAMNAGVTTSVEITQTYIDRIAAYDDVKIDPAADGRPLNSIITVGEATALEAAAAADAVRAADGMTSMLLGVPVAVKDNYNTVDMVTTAGCGCWDDNQTATDAFMVAGLRDAGAVILAKASLDEFAFGFESQFSSFQPAGERTYVASPYATTRTAGGSSGGTGAAISANLAGIGFGTDTGGSIRVPSSYNQLVGVRPTVGLASRDGIVPLALSQDTGGPMTRSVLDAAVALDAVVGIDEADAATSRQQGLVPASYTQLLATNALDGARIGYVASMIPTDPTTARLWAETKAQFEQLGAEVVEVPTSDALNTVLREGSGSTNEFKRDLNEYIATHLSSDVTSRSLDAILEGGKFVPERRRSYEQRNAITEETYQAWAGPNGTHTTVLADGKTLVTGMLDSMDLDALVYPSGTPYGTHSTNLRLSPNTGMPSVTVPMGQAIAGEQIPGANVNIEFLGRDFAEGTLLGLAYAFEQATHHRTAPALYPPLG